MQLFFGWTTKTMDRLQGWVDGSELLLIAHARRCNISLYSLLCWTRLCTAFANNVDPDQLASSILFSYKYVNLYQQPGSSNPTGCKFPLLLTHLSLIFFPRTVPLWKSLPASVAEAPSLASLRKELATISVEMSDARALVPPRKADWSWWAKSGWENILSSALFTFVLFIYCIMFIINDFRLY